MDQELGPRHGDPLSRRQRLSSVEDAVAKAGRGHIGELTQPEISTTTEDKRLPDLRLHAGPRVSVSVEEARQSKDERDAVNDDTRLGCTHRHHGNRTDKNDKRREPQESMAPHAPARHE